jgi:hypothetical protein
MTLQRAWRSGLAGSRGKRMAGEPGSRWGPPSARLRASVQPKRSVEGMTLPSCSSS